jgi:hypothetical protein
VEVSHQRGIPADPLPSFPTLRPGGWSLGRPLTASEALLSSRLGPEVQLRRYEEDHSLPRRMAHLAEEYATYRRVWRSISLRSPERAAAEAEVLPLVRRAQDAYAQLRELEGGGVPAHHRPEWFLRRRELLLETRTALERVEPLLTHRC